MNRWLRLVLIVLAILVGLAVLALALLGGVLLYMHFNPIRLG